MLKDIRKLKLLGANFDSSTLFDIFNKHEGNKIKTVKGALLYGKNGTGKSTIARAFRKIAGEDIPIIQEAAFCNDEDAPVIITTEEQKEIFVFDEDYVDRNVKLQQDHLDTIVMLGKMADLTEQIKKAKTELDAAGISYKQQEKVYQEYCGENNVKSPKYYINKMIETLQGDENWAGRDRIINDKRQNTSVRIDTYKQFREITPSKQKTELLIEYAVGLKELEAAKKGVSVINLAVPSIPNLYTQYDDAAVQKILALKIEKPELSEREKRLFQLVQEGKAGELASRLPVFQNEHTTECPYCFQTITQEYKKSLTESIERVLSREVEEHQENIKKHIVAQIIIDLSPFKNLEGYNSCIDLMEKANASIQENNGKLTNKNANPYEPIIIEVTNIKLLINQINQALIDLEKSRIKYNEQSKNTEPIITKLVHINGEIAHYEIKDLAEQFDKQQDEFVQARKLYNDFKSTYEIKTEKVSSLEEQKSSIRLALDAINACMKYIFFAENRLKIECVDGVYKLLSRGKSVRPCDVSAGERNVIGLSYFFTSILEGQEEKDAYGKEYLLVIDDPISSYDMENKIGILSFLKYKLSMFLEGNQYTKALVMTHDLISFYDIHKIFEEIVNVCKQENYSNAPKFNYFEMSENKLKLFAYKNRQEYTESIKNIYAYASGEIEEQDLVIGNIMRRVLEAFSTFVYRKGIEDVSTDEKILALLPEPAYISYYQNLMYRLVLHGGSHKQEEVNAMQDFNFFSLISTEEKKRTAKDILCFIYLLNQRHLLEHLGDSVEINHQLESWCQEIKARAV